MEHMKDGGGAFPRPNTMELNGQPQVGMSTRTWLAGQAMKGILASRDFTAGTNERNANRYVARNAVSYADALLEELTSTEAQPEGTT